MESAVQFMPENVLPMFSSRNMVSCHIEVFNRF